VDNALERGLECGLVDNGLERGLERGLVDDDDRRRNGPVVGLRGERIDRGADLTREWCLRFGSVGKRATARRGGLGRALDRCDGFERRLCIRLGPRGTGLRGGARAKWWRRGLELRLRLGLCALDGRRGVGIADRFRDESARHRLVVGGGRRFERSLVRWPGGG